MILAMFIYIFLKLTKINFLSSLNNFKSIKGLKPYKNNAKQVAKNASSLSKLEGSLVHNNSLVTDVFKFKIS